MIKSEIEKLFIENGKIKKYLIKKHHIEFDKIKELTNFLNDNVTEHQRIYHVYNSVGGIPLCIGNNNKKFCDFNIGYLENCKNQKCICWTEKYKLRTEKTKQSNLEKYGVENVFQSEIIKDKIKETNIERYGAENPFQSEIIKDKIKQSFLDNYGVEYISQSKEIQDKIKINNKEKYNVEYVSQLESFKNKVKQTNLERYGCGNVFQSEIIKDKIKETNLERYGVEFISQNIEIRNKIKKTTLERHGVSCVFQKDGVLDKVKQTNNEKYGVDFPLQSDVVHDKIKIYNNEKFGVDYPLQSEEVRNKVAQANIDKYGTKNVSTGLILQKYPDIEQQSFWDLFNNFSEINNHLSELAKNTILVYCKRYRPDLSPTSQITIPHHIIIDFLNSNNIEFLVNTRKVIAPLELDVYIPSHNISTEINGIFWHCEKNSKDKNYHLNKLERCEELGIKLLQFTDYEILNKTELVLSMIANQLGLNSNKIMARKCSVKQIDKKTANEFFDKNHIQGSCISSIQYGLFYKDELVSAISFAKPRFNKNYDYEVIRFANKINHKIIGSFSKLMKHSNLKGKFISYANRMISNGNLYEKCGWKLENVSVPSYWYTKDYKHLEHRTKYQKHKLETILETYNPELTEFENMNNNGYERYWDCGTKVYSYGQ